MQGKFYAIKKGCITTEIQSLISEPKYGGVIILDTHPVYECIIEVEDLTDVNAVELSVPDITVMIQEFTIQPSQI